MHHLKTTRALVLIGLLVLAALLSYSHRRAAATGRTSFAENAVRVVAKPFQSAANGIGGVWSGAARSVRTRRALRRENARLRADVRRLNLEAMRLREDAAEAHRLREAMSFAEAFPEKLLAARIISREPSGWFSTATIDRGRTSGVRPGQAVITPRGLLGQIYLVSPNTAQVRALTGPQGGVGAMVERSRAIGVCEGRDSDSLELGSLAKDADVVVGDIIISSGHGGVMPKGIPIGRVVKVALAAGGFTKTARLRPSVRLDQAEECLVLMKEIR